METIKIKLDPSARHYEAYGREKHADVHFRINIEPYVRALNDYSEEARKAEREAVSAFDDEVVAMLKADGWTLYNKGQYGPGECPQLVKDAQYLYCHPQDISGNVLADDVERLARMIASMKSCKYRWTDNYGDVIITTSDDDEYKLYEQTYSNTQVTEVFAEMLTTKRKNLFKCEWDVKRNIQSRLAIPNRRTDLHDIGTGCYRDRRPLVDFVQQHYFWRLNAGLIKEDDGANGMPLCRWANKAEQKALGF